MIKSWRDITLRTYQRIYPELTQDISKFNLVQQQVWWLKIFEGLGMEISDDVSTVELQSMIHKHIWLLNRNTPNYELIIDGVEYGFDNDIFRWQVNTLTDTDNYISKSDDLLDRELETIDNLHYILAVLVRPVEYERKLFKRKKKLRKYIPDEVEERANLFLDKMNAEHANSYVGFFLDFAKLYSINSLQSSIQSLIHQLQES